MPILDVKFSTPIERDLRSAIASTLSSITARVLRKKQELERRQRIKEYNATLAIMKKRGVKGLGATARKSGRAPRQASQPLQVFAEGDSWFDYPVPFFGGGIIPRLEDKLGVPILNLAKAGDEVRYMLGVKERKLPVSGETRHDQAFASIPHRRRDRVSRRGRGGGHPHGRRIGRRGALGERRGYRARPRAP